MVAPQNVTFNLDTGMTGEEQLGAGGDFFGTARLWLRQFDAFCWLAKPQAGSVPLILYDVYSP